MPSAARNLKSVEWILHFAMIQNQMKLRCVQNDRINMRCVQNDSIDILIKSKMLCVSNVNRA